MDLLSTNSKAAGHHYRNQGAVILTLCRTTLFHSGQA
jgi:hypothetical protein